jgi:polyisoprenoid-binding protein YceI
MKTLFVLLLIASATLTAQNKWKIETSHSNINFSVAHLVVSEVTGRFREFSGVIESIWDDFSDMKITVNIKANSVDTDEPQRDADLKGPNFFDADKYNNITFKSTGVEKTGEMKYKVTGDLTLRGFTNPVVLDVIFKGKTKSPSGQMVAIFRASTTIDRTQWGLKWNRTLETGGLLVGENVNLIFNIELVQM